MKPTKHAKEPSTALEKKTNKKEDAKELAHALAKSSRERSMDSSMVKGVFEVMNAKGLHARPCAEIARCAARFRSQIYIVFEKKKVEAKSLLGLLTLAAGQGCQLSVQAKGTDAEAAVAAIVELSQKQFGMEY